jgi:predicted RNase H-like HicB family nuclease
MSTSNKTKLESLEFYLGLKYPITIYPDDQGGYVSEIKDLPGCFTQGETIEETLANIDDARKLWLETAYEYGDHIPLPSTNIRCEVESF